MSVAAVVCQLDDTGRHHWHHCFRGHVDGKLLHLADDIFLLCGSLDDSSGISLASSGFFFHHFADQTVAAFVLQNSLICLPLVASIMSAKFDIATRLSPM